MNYLMGKRLITSVFLAFMAMFFITACGDNAVDKYLDDYEKFVVSYEELAKGDVTPEASADLMKQVEEFGNKAMELSKSNAKFSDAQIKRQQALTERMTKAIQAIQTKALTLP